MAHHTRPNPETLHGKVGPSLQRVGSYKTGGDYLPNFIKVTWPTQTYPSSVQNLNRLTMTVDVDIYDEDSQKVEIPAGSMPENSPIKVRLCPRLLLLPGGDNEDEEKGQDGDPSDAGIPHSEGGRETQTYQGASILFSG